MNLKQMYEFFVQAGIENDPRGKDEVNTKLKEINEKYNNLDKQGKEDFDTD